MTDDDKKRKDIMSEARRLEVIKITRDRIIRNWNELHPGAKEDLAEEWKRRNKSQMIAQDLLDIEEMFDEILRDLSRLHVFNRTSMEYRTKINTLVSLLHHAQDNPEWMQKIKSELDLVLRQIDEKIEEVKQALQGDKHTLREWISKKIEKHNRKQRFIGLYQLIEYDIKNNYEEICHKFLRQNQAAVEAWILEQAGRLGIEKEDVEIEWPLNFVCVAGIREWKWRLAIVRFVAHLRSPYIEWFRLADGSAPGWPVTAITKPAILEKIDNETFKVLLPGVVGYN